MVIPTPTCMQGQSNPGPLVVLVHGFVGSSSYFFWLAKCLVEKYGRRVLRFDNYGRGNSGCYGDPHTARLFAGQLAEVYAGMYVIASHRPALATSMNRRFPLRLRLVSKHCTKPHHTFTTAAFSPRRWLRRVLRYPQPLQNRLSGLQHGRRYCGRVRKHFPHQNQYRDFHF